MHHDWHSTKMGPINTYQASILFVIEDEDENVPYENTVFNAYSDSIQNLFSSFFSIELANYQFETGISLKYLTSIALLESQISLQQRWFPHLG